VVLLKQQNKEYLKLELSLNEIFLKYKNYKRNALQDILKDYFGKITFIHNRKEEDNLLEDYYPVGNFQIGSYNNFYIHSITNQCGLRIMERYFNCIDYNFLQKNNLDFYETPPKLNIILFIYILKTLYEIKPDILYLLSDVESSYTCEILNFFSVPVYKLINPNTGNLINYYMLNAKTSNLL